MLCYAVLCHAMLRCALPCYVVRRFSMVCHALRGSAVLWDAMSSCAVLRCVLRLSLSAPRLLLALPYALFPSRAS